MMNGLEFINATDQRKYYMEGFLKMIIYGYQSLIDSKTTYSRAGIHTTIKTVQKSAKSHNEIEDYLCTDLVKNYIKPNLGQFGLENIVVDTGVRENKCNVTVGHLDIKFQVPSLSENHYYAFEAKRLDKNKAKQKYYLDGGIQRFTERIYYPETTTIVAGMIGFVEIDISTSKKGRVPLGDIKDSLNKLIAANKAIKTTQQLTDHFITDTNHSFIEDFKHMYLSKHTRDDDGAELKIYHLFLDYYDILQN